MKKPKAQTKHPRPDPPDDITGPALIEWDRICTAVEAQGREIKPADRSILATYCRTWLISQAMNEHVQKFGACVKWSNGVVGQSPQFKTFSETVKLLRGLLADLGATPASRDFDEVKDDGPKELPPIKF